jgi:hypothetical protein
MDFFMDYDKLLTYEQAKKLLNKRLHSYSLRVNGQSLYYFGSNHSRNAKDSQFLKLDKFWKQFLSETTDQPKIVIVEGGLSRRVKQERETFKFGENGYISFKAKTHNIKVVSPEPPLKYEANLLAKEYSKEEIEYYYFARIVYQWHTLPDPKPSLKLYLGRYLSKDKKSIKWPGFKFTIKNLEKIHVSIFHKPINYLDFKFFNNLLNPFKLIKVNRVGIKSDIIRDKHILKEIEKYWKKKYSIFIVYGSAHAIMQQPVLEDMVESN